MPAKRSVKDIINNLGYEARITKKKISNFMKKTPEEKMRYADFQKALSTFPDHKPMVERNRRLELEMQVNKDIDLEKQKTFEREQAARNKARGTQSSSVRKIIK